MASLDLTFLGGFRACSAAGEDFVLPGRKGQLLLAYLALHAGEVQTREKVIGLLWSDRGDAQARGSLRQELMTLRKALGKAERSPIVIDGERLWLDSAVVGVDVRRFEELVLSDETAAIEAAVELYRGPFLDGLIVRDPACEEWLAQERERLRLLLLGALDRLLERRMKAGELARATTIAETILVHDPLREDAHRALMLLYAAQDRRGLALRQYQICRDTLARELGVEPEPETDRVYDDIQAQRASAPNRRTAAGEMTAALAAPTEASSRTASAVSTSASSRADTEAYQFYLMGRSFFLRNVWGRGALDAARQLFLQAIEIDPRYARAYAGLANCDCYRLLLGVPDASFDTIAANSARALELEPDLAEAHATKGLALYTAEQHVAADEAFEQAVRLGPELFEAHYFYARNCRTQGLHAKAAELFERAASLNQNDYRALGLLVDEYRALGRLEDSLSAARRCLEKINVEVAAQPDDGYALAFGSNILAELGERERAEEWAARANRIDPDDAIVNYNLACTYAQLRRPDAALDRLRATFAAVPINRRAFFEWMQHDTALDPVRDNADFRTLVAQLEADSAISPPDRTDAFRTARTREHRPAIAVLPFANISGDPEQEYFADGLTEDIITDLSRVSALFVVARNSVFAFKGKAVAVREAARELNVDYLLEGSVRQAEGRVRITAQLVDARTGGHLWAERYDRSLEGIFALQDEISQSIVAALKLQLLPDERATITSRPTASAEAYRYYLMGRSHFLRGGRGQRALRLARQMFGKAIEVDPRYARAYAGLANCDSYLLCLGDTATSFEEILANSEYALALEPDLPEAHAARGLALYMSGCHDEAEVALGEAVRLGPGLFEAHYFSARNHQAQGYFERAAAAFERAAAIEPEDFLALGIAIATYRSLGREEAMRSAARRCLEKVAAEISARPDNAGALAFGASVQAELGDPAVAESWVVRAAALDPANAIVNYNVACAYAALGKLAAAAEHLQEVFAHPSANWRSHFEWMKHDSSLDPLRGHPEFQALLQRLETELDPPARAVESQPAIAVLPFDSLSGDSEQQYLADGIVDEITAALSRVRSFFVIARSSTMRYRNRSVDAARVGRELGVRYLLRGSVRVSTNRVRISVQLLEAASGSCIWADRYEGGREEVFDFEDRITERTVGAIEPTIRWAEIERARRKRPDNLEAYDYVMRALPHVWALTPEDCAEALRLTTEAVRLDPGHARANALAAWCHAFQFANGWAPSPAQSRAEGQQLAQAALRHGGDDPDVLIQAAACAMMLTGDLEVAALHIGKALALDPNSAWGWIRSGYLHVWRCEPEAALTHFERAARLSPFDPLDFNRHIGIALAHFVAGRYREAVDWAEKGRLERPGLPWAYRVLAAAYAQLGQHDQARAAAQTALKQHPQLSVSEIMATAPFRQDEVRERLAHALRQAGIPDVAAEGGAADGAGDAPVPLEGPSADRPAVAVLPFDNQGDPQQQYFSDGITEDIITELSRWRQLTVLSRNSSFRHRDISVDVRQVGRDLGVDYLVEGSVRRMGDRIRVTAQLIETATGSHVWAERYDRGLEEIFAVQDEVVKTIVGTLVGRVQAAGVERARRKPPMSLAAYDCVLRAHALPWGDPESDAEARRLYEKAVELDPEYGLAHALLALMMYAEWGADTGRSDAALDRAFELAKKAVELDENESTCQFVLGLVHLMRRSFDLAEQYHRRAFEMNPSNPQHLADMGSLLVYFGRADEGVEWLLRARRVDPYFGPAWYWHQLGFAYMTARRYDDAIKAFERSITMPYWVRAYIAACHAYLGRMTQAKEWAAEALRLEPAFSTTGNASKEPFRHQRDADHLIDGLRKAGIPETASPAAAEACGHVAARLPLNRAGQSAE